MQTSRQSGDANPDLLRSQGLGSAYRFGNLSKPHGNAACSCESVQPACPMHSSTCQLHHETRRHSVGLPLPPNRLSPSNGGTCFLGQRPTAPESLSDSYLHSPAPKEVPARFVSDSDESS